MWVFTEWANAFDKVKSDNEKALDSWLQDWVASTLYEDHAWYRNAAVYAGAGLAYSVNTLSTTVLRGFVDVLRLGDGVREGGWGYGADALRLLTFVGPLVRAGRFGISLVAAVDETSSVGNCTWIAASRALRLTGVRHYARLGDVAKAAGMEISETGGAFADDLVPPLRLLGADAKVLGKFSSMREVIEAAQTNPDGVIMFSVEWEMGGKTVGHTLLATRGPFGVIRIIDRTGKSFSLVDGYSLAELERLVPAYQGISSATVYGSGAVVGNAKIVNLLNNAPLLTNIVGVELRSVPVPAPLLQPAYVDLRKKSVVGRWKFEIPAWQPSSEERRYAEGWTGIIEFQGVEGDLSGKCFWTGKTGGERHPGTWSVKVSEELQEILTFQFTDDDPVPAKRRTFSAPVGNAVCQGYYKNPGWPNGWFRIAR